MSKGKVVILGAGPGGLASAFFYHQNGFHVTIIEKTNNAGGLARGISFLGNKYDLGPHSFYSNYSSETKEFYDRFIGKENYSKIIPSKIIQTSDKILFYSPFRFTCVLKWSNLLFFFAYAFHKLRTLFSFSKNNINDKHGYWVNKKIFQPYCKKYFNLNHDKVSNDFGALLYENTDKGDDTVYLPSSGYMGKLWENVYDYLVENGIDFKFNQTVTNIEKENNQIIQITTENNTFKDVDYFVSTIPLQLIHKLIFPASKSQFRLNYRATIVVYLEVTKLKTNALYLTNYDLDNIIGRISFCSNWRNDNKNLVISIEVWCDVEDEIFSASDEIITKQIVDSLSNLSVIEVSNNSQSKVIKIPKCYPILEKGYNNELDNINKDLNIISNLKLIGRHGQFKWDGIDDIISAAHNE